jgi:hypothetical protein
MCAPIIEAIISVFEFIFGIIVTILSIVLSIIIFPFVLILTLLTACCGGCGSYNRGLFPAFRGLGGGNRRGINNRGSGIV